MDAALHRRHRDRRMHVIRRGNIHGVEFLFGEQDAVILVNARVWKFLAEFEGPIGIHFCDGDNLDGRMGRERVEVGPRHPGGAKTGMSHLARGRIGQKISGDERHGQCTGSAEFQKSATRDLRRVVHDNFIGTLSLRSTGLISGCCFKGFYSEALDPDKREVEWGENEWMFIEHHTGPKASALMRNLDAFVLY